MIDSKDFAVALTSRLRVLAMALVTIFLMLLAPATAFAYAPTGGDFIECIEEDDEDEDDDSADDSDDSDDGDIECVAGVFEEGCEVTFEATDEDGNVIDSGTVTADDDGEVEFTLDIGDNDPEDLTITVRCDEGDNPKVLSDELDNVLAAPGDGDDDADDDDEDDEDDDDLANTGADTLTVLSVALGAVALGGLVLGVSRRRGNETA